MGAALGHREELEEVPALRAASEAGLPGRGPLSRAPTQAPGPSLGQLCSCLTEDGNLSPAPRSPLLGGRRPPSLVDSG